MENQVYPVDEFLSEFSKALQIHELQCSTEKMKMLYLFYVELVEMNRVMNLTAITKMDDVIYKHFIDCMLIEKFHLLQDGMKLIDVGTGAGFPGFVLAILYDKLQIVLMDSLQKRVQFLRNLGEKLGLHNVEYIHARAEELAANPNYRECFDVATSRAVANLSTLSEYCLPFVKKGGQFIAYKSKGVDTEIHNAINAFSILGGQLKSVEYFNLNYQDNHRSLVIVEKKHRTPQKYPRKSGMPSRQPLS